MTVSYEDVAVSNNASGSDSSFAIGNITFTDNADIDVYIRDVGESPPTEVLKTLTTHYYLTDSAGNQTNPATHVKFDTSAGHTLPASDQKVVIKRKILLTQSTDYAAGDAFPADSHEAALDKLTLQVQQMQEQIDRAWTYPETYGFAAGELSNVKMPEPGNNGIIKYNADASAIVLDTDLADATYKMYGANTSDSTAGFLNDKLLAGSGLSKTAVTSADTNQTVTLAIDATVATLTGTQTLENKRLTSPKLNEDVAITATATEVNILDGVTATTSELNIMDGVTATTSELNIMDGVTATASELNIMDGVTATTSELNILDGVTSTASELNILDGVTSTASELNILDGVTASTSELNIMDGVTASTSELNIMDGVTASTSELNIMDGVTASTSELNIMDGVTASTSELNIMDGVTASTSELNIMDGVTSTATELNILDGVTASTSELNIMDGVTATTSELNIMDGVTSTAGEINLLDGSAKSTSSITIADDDAFLVIDGTTSKQIPASDIKTYAGGGGGAGSIDTLFTMQAKSESAAYTVRGNGYVWSGAGSFANATLDLETTAADLIQGTKVFAYDNSTTSGIRNWWYHEQVIQPGYGGKNMVLQLQYFTRNCADSNIFRFYARNASKPIFTSSGSADGSNTVAGVVTWDASLPVGEKQGAAIGDRVVLLDTSNVIHYRYITAVSTADLLTDSGSLTITYSGSDIAAANSTVMLVGVMSDELDYLPANNVTGNEAKIYRKQMTFDAGCTLLQFGFLVQTADVDVELYYDDIALSANQFLQTSSQGQPEEYRARILDHAGTKSNRMIVNASSGVVTKNSIDKLGTINNDTTNGWYFQANERCRINISVSLADSNSSGGFGIMKFNVLPSSLGDEAYDNAQWDGYRISGGQDTNGSGYQGNVSAECVMEKGDYIQVVTDWGNNDTQSSSKSVLNLCVTPLVNDVVLLNSQDEIFTDWVSDGTFFSHVTTSSGSISQGSTTVDSYHWKRDGSDMIIRFQYQQTSAGSEGTGMYFISLPSGYVADTSVIKTYTAEVGTGGQYLELGSGYCGSIFGGDDSQGWMVIGHGALYSESKLRVGLFWHGGPNSGWWGQDSPCEFSQTNFGLMGELRIPIAGWNANFNPVLSMPLVDIGRDTEAITLQDPRISTAGSSNRVYYGTALDTSSYDGSLFTYDNDSEDGLKITFNQNVDADVNFGVHATSAQWIGIAKNYDSVSAQAINIPTGNCISFGNTGTANTRQLSFSGKFKAGDYLFFHCNVNSTSADGDRVCFSMTARRDRSNTNMAHIIKPAVCALKDLKAYNQEGGNSSTGTNTRVLNSIEGESWFVTGSFDGVDGSNTNFSLEPGAYKLTGNFEMYKTDRSFCWLYDVTNSTYRSDWVGNASYQHSGSGIGSGQTHLNIPYLAITSSTTFNIKHYVESGLSSEGWGVGHDQSGYNTCYATLVIEKLK